MKRQRHTAVQVPEYETEVNVTAHDIDHNYSRKSACTETSGIQSGDVTPDSPNKILDNSAENVIGKNSSGNVIVDLESGFTEDDNLDSESHDSSFEMDKNMLHECSDTSTDCESDTVDSHDYHHYVTEKKVVVFEGELDKLLWRSRCSECDGPVDEVRKVMAGSGMSVKIFCINGHTCCWRSQPFFGQQPVGNLLLAGATLFSGETFGHMKHFSNLINLQFISQTTFDNIQRSFLIPVIAKSWEKERENMLALTHGNSLKLCGDGRCDSPGYSAKYCSYTLMDMESKRVVDFNLVQVSETGSSVRMEKLGYERTMDNLLEKGVNISLCATDRHVQIRKLHREKYKPMGILHEFDVYHMANSVRKDLKAKASKKKYSALQPWMRSIINYLWWAAATCDGNPDVLEEKWLSIVDHVANKHTFDKNKYFKACSHDSIIRNQEVVEPARRQKVPSADGEPKKKWLKEGSPAHNALSCIVRKPRLVKDIRMLASFCHTGILESFHSLVLKYAPKRHEFDYNQMEARLQLAVLDHNYNANRQQAIIKKPRIRTGLKGESRYRTRYSKATDQWIVEPIKESKSYGFAKEMLSQVLEMKSCGQELPKAVRPAHVPQNIAKKSRPSKAELVARHKTRFTLK